MKKKKRRYVNIEFSEKIFLSHCTYSNAICYATLYAKKLRNYGSFQIGQKDFGFNLFPFWLTFWWDIFLKENIEPLEYDETWWNSRKNSKLKLLINWTNSQPLEFVLPLLNFSLLLQRKVALMKNTFCRKLSTDK